VLASLDLGPVHATGTTPARNQHNLELHAEDDAATIGIAVLIMGAVLGAFIDEAVVATVDHEILIAWPASIT
jgi:hypothetical protein